MNAKLAPLNAPVCRARSLSAFSLLPVLAMGLGVMLAPSGLQAQDRPARGDRGGEQGGRGGGERGNFNPQEMQARMATALRERLEITDDEEWKLISERITKVTELRRSTGGGVPFGPMMAGRGGPQPGGPGGPGGGGPRPGMGNNPEVAALAMAVRDKLPDAEIKTRLERLREQRRDSEAKLAKAQDELRAVLTVRQEAIAVVFGLLP